MNGRHMQLEFSLPLSMHNLHGTEDRNGGGVRWLPLFLGAGPHPGRAGISPFSLQPLTFFSFSLHLLQ